MADIAVDRLIVDIEARTRQFEGQLKKLEGQVSGSSQRMSKNFNALNSSIANAGKTFASAFGATLGVGLLAQLPRLMAKSIDELGAMTDAAQKAGVSIANLQKLTFAGIGTGTGQGNIVSMMEMFNKRIGEAATKGGELAELFQANGVSLRDNNGAIRDNVDLLAQVADLVKNARTEQEATVIATMALGRSGAELLPFLKQGGDLIRALMQAAVDAGFVINDKLVKGADEFADRWTIAWASFVKRGQGALGEMLAEFQNFGRVWSGDRMTKGSIFSQKSGDIQFETDAERSARELKDAMARRNDLLAQRNDLGPSRDNLVSNVLDAQIVGINKQIEALEKRNRLLNPDVRDDRAGPFNGGLGTGKVSTIVPLQGEKQGPKFDPNFVSEIDKAKRSLDQQIAAINARSAALGASEGAIARMNAQQDIMNTLAEHHILLSAKDTAALNAQLQALQTAVDGQQTLIDKQKGLADASNSITDSMREFTFGVIDDVKSVGDQAIAMLKKLEMSLLDSILFGGGPFAKMMGNTNTNGSPGGLIGNLIGGLFGANKSASVPGLMPSAANVVPVATGGGAGGRSAMGAALGAFGNMTGAPVSAIGGVPYASLINEAAAKHGLDPSLLAALIKQESGFNPAAHSGAGAIGLAQLMPGTAKDLGVTNPWDPRQNVMGGADYLAQQMKRFGGNTPQALAAYNWGPGNVAKFGTGNMPQETQDYVKNIMASQQRYSAALSNVATKTAAAGTDFTSGFGGALQNILGGVGGAKPAAGGGGLSGLLDLLFGGGAAPSLYAKGGTLGHGKWGIAGEAGPELIHGPARVTPMRGGGYGGGNVKFNVVAAPGLPISRKKNISGGLDVMIGDFMESKFPSMFDKQARGYGLRPPLTSRT